MEKPRIHHLPIVTLPADCPRAANDNVWAFGPPVVRAPRRRPDAPYARSANVLLPLRFAERMRGWQPPPAPPVHRA